VELYIKLSQYIVSKLIDMNQENFTPNSTQIPTFANFGTRIQNPFSNFDFEYYCTPPNLGLVLPPNPGSAFPPKPFFLAVSHFYTAENPDLLIAKITACLDNYIGVTYIFHNNYHWACVCADKSNITKFDIALYSDTRPETNTEETIIEINRLNGDAILFYKVYNSIKNAFGLDVYQSNFDMYKNLDYNSLPMSDEEVAEEFAPIFRMINEPFPCALQAGATILCDMSFQDDKRKHLFTHCVISKLNTILESLQSEEYDKNYYKDETLRLVTVTIGQLSNFCEFHQQIIDSRVVYKLFEFATDGPYNNAQMRRACAQTISNICNNLDERTIAIIDNSPFVAWLKTAETIKDTVIKQYIQNSLGALELLV